MIGHSNNLNNMDEILKKVRLLEIRSRKKVENLLSGEYHTHFRGQGMTFSDFREYVPGDDIRSISWPVTARTGKTHIKKFDEERELTAILALDVSGSTQFGTHNQFKSEVITQLAALLGFTVITNRDQVGMVLFSDRIEHYVPPSKGRSHMLRLLRDLHWIKPQGRGTRIDAVIKHLNGVLKKRSIIFLISDFQDQHYEGSLRQLSKRHEVIALVIQDEAEETIPNWGLVEIEDPETGEKKVIDTENPIFQKWAGSILEKGRETRDKILKLSQVDQIHIHTQGPILEPLIAFFRRRRKR